MTTAPIDFVSAEPASGPTGDGYYGLSAAEFQTLGNKCLEARATAYCPYSLFRVGASLLLRTASPSGEPNHIITGANVENASYPVGTCAERVAMGSAVIQGYRLGSFKAIGVATDMDDFCSPCGMCRQFLREFLELETPIFMFNKQGQFKIRTMGELLPLSFGPDVLPPREALKEAQDADKAKTA
ncbi:cytidine deaminase [Lophiostoma macrostomum CBS 122681]|uniref:Cytidine deaminase n=1 Tax=Lophiostoma macrostomum CBS 122681 TaxID=1314788 RepID=A0A6A6SP05_9PLEO|nr:cytidine deaminase [Lophiostoma macrostomum CBS 122681]